MRKNCRSSFLPSRLRPLSAALLMLLGLPAEAATITVDSDADGSVAQHCTLRDAVAAANTDAAVAACAAGSGADTIQFAPVVASITLTSAAGGELFVSDELVVDGQGRPVTIRREAADAPFRLLESAVGVPLDLRWLKLTGGRTDAQTMNRGGAGVHGGGPLRLSHCEVSGNLATQRGGGITSEADLDLVDSIVSGNATTGQQAGGGGIYAYAEARLTRSVVSDNTTSGTYSGGGGIGTRQTNIELIATTVSGNWTSGDNSFGGGFNAPMATVVLTDSTISGNSTEGDNAWGGGGYASVMQVAGTTVSANSTSGGASYGGGLFSIGAEISNSTISGNSTAGEGAWGGGVVVAGTSSLRNSTLFGNRVASASGSGLLVLMASAATVVSLQSSLLFGNGVSADDDVGLFDTTGETASFTLAGDHNLIGTSSDAVVVPPDTLHCDPSLQPLAANGGATLTHRLGDGSCAIDAGANPDALAADQRGAGYERTFGAATDIGAVERQPADEKIFANGFDAG